MLVSDSYSNHTSTSSPRRCDIVGNAAPACLKHQLYHLHLRNDRDVHIPDEDCAVLNNEPTLQIVQTVHSPVCAPFMVERQNPGRIVLTALSTALV